MFENLSIEQLVQLPVLAGLVWFFALNSSKKIDLLSQKVDDLAKELNDFRIEFTELKTRVMGNGLSKALDELKSDFERCKEMHQK
jgi:hypothetical protein